MRSDAVLHILAKERKKGTENSIEITKQPEKKCFKDDITLLSAPILVSCNAPHLILGSLQRKLYTISPLFSSPIKPHSAHLPITYCEQILRGVGVDG